MSGDLFVANASAIRGGEGRTFCVGVRAMDGGNLTAETVVNVFVVNKNVAPEVTDKVVRVPENKASGSNITLVQAIDSTAGSLTFSILACGVGSNGTLDCDGRNTMFSIDNDKGGYDGAWLMLGTSQLNYEDTVFEGEAHEYWLTVQAKDADLLVPLSGFGTVRIIVVDVDEAPTFSNPSFSVNEARVSGAFVGDLSSYADDQDVDSQLTFSLDDALTFPGTMTWVRAFERPLNGGEEGVESWL
jgi:hypothetical protein